MKTCTAFRLLVAALGLSLVASCSILSYPRRGLFIFEDTLRTTSDPAKLVARVGFFQQTGINSGERATLEAMVTIDVNTGEISLGYPLDVNVKVNEPISECSSDHYDDGGPYLIGLNNDSTATLSGGLLTDPFTFAYTGPLPVPPPYSHMDEPYYEGGMSPAYFYSSSLNRLFFFYNTKLPSENNVPFQRDAMVSILDLSDPKSVSVKAFNYSGFPGYFNGPILNFWDDDGLQVVELPGVCCACVLSVFLRYNETGVSLLEKVYQGSPNSFPLNAISYGPGGDASFVYNIKNVENRTNFDTFDNNFVFPTGYILEKTDIATGEKSELELQNISGLLPEDMTIVVQNTSYERTRFSRCEPFWSSYPLANFVVSSSALPTHNGEFAIFLAAIAATFLYLA